VCVFPVKLVVRLSVRWRRVVSGGGGVRGWRDIQRERVSFILSSAPPPPHPSAVTTRPTESLPRPSARRPSRRGSRDTTVVWRFLGKLCRASVRSVRHACHGIRESRPCGRENWTRWCIICKWVAQQSLIKTTCYTIIIILSCCYIVRHKL